MGEYSAHFAPLHGEVLERWVTLLQPGENLKIRIALRRPEEGVRVICIKPGGPFHRAGMPCGQLLEINGQRIETEVDLVDTMAMVEDCGMVRFPVKIVPDPSQAVPPPYDPKNFAPVPSASGGSAAEQPHQAPAPAGRGQGLVSTRARAAVPFLVEPTVLQHAGNQLVPAKAVLAQPPSSARAAGCGTMAYPNSFPSAHARARNPPWVSSNGLPFPLPKALIASSGQGPLTPHGRGRRDDSLSTVS